MREWMYWAVAVALVILVVIGIAIMVIGWTGVVVGAVMAVVGVVAIGRLADLRIYLEWTDGR